MGEDFLRKKKYIYKIQRPFIKINKFHYIKKKILRKKKEKNLDDRHHVNKA